MLSKELKLCINEYNSLKDKKGGEGKMLSSEIEQLKKKFIKNRGQTFKEVCEGACDYTRGPKFFCQGYCWKDLGPATLEKRAVLSKFCGTKVWNEEGFRLRVPSPSSSEYQAYLWEGKQDEGGKGAPKRPSTETLRYFQVCWHLKAADHAIQETLICFHVFAPSNKEIFDLLDQEEVMLPRKFLELADEFERVKDTESGEGKRLKFEIGQEKRRCMENRGELVEEVKIDEFVGSGYCWRDLGVVTLKERAVLSKFCGARVWNEPRVRGHRLKEGYRPEVIEEDFKLRR